MDLEFYQTIIKQLDEKLTLLKTNPNRLFLIFEEAKGLCLLTFWEMKRTVVEHGFKNQLDEIYFFKKIKPQILSKLIFYEKLILVESRRPHAFHLREEYLKRKVEEFNKFFEDNQDLCVYYWKNEESLDSQFFVRKNRKHISLFEVSVGIADPDFSTQHDFTFACVIAYENLIKYLENEIAKIHLQGTLPGSFYSTVMKWTGNKIDLVELAYALHSISCINNGNIDIKEITEALSKLFNIELDDYYRTYQDIRTRKTERIKFLDKLKQALQQRLDESDA